MTKLKTLAAGLALMAGLAAAPLTAQAESLPEPVQQALRDALQDERYAEAFYAAVMQKHGGMLLCADHPGPSSGMKPC